RGRRAEARHSIESERGPALSDGQPAAPLPRSHQAARARGLGAQGLAGRGAGSYAALLPGADRVKVAVIGTGYVGLTTGVGLSSIGHDVTCVDVSPERLETIRKGRAPFHEPGLPELMARVIGDGRLHASEDLRQAVLDSEIVFITVGTPDGPRGIDLKYVTKAAEDSGRALRESSAYRVVVVKST